MILDPFDKDKFDRDLKSKIERSLMSIRSIPISVLIWGPNPFSKTPVAKCRLALRESLEKLGHLCYFSEELFKPGAEFSLLAQQVAQVENFDLVVSIPESPGSIAEIHDFAIIPNVGNKILTFLDSRWDNGYSNTTLAERDSFTGPKIVPYDESMLPDPVLKRSLQEVQRLQEMMYILKRRL